MTEYVRENFPIFLFPQHIDEDMEIRVDAQDTNRLGYRIIRENALAWIIRVDGSERQRFRNLPKGLP